MPITYTFSSLHSIADHLEQRATELRVMSQRTTRKTEAREYKIRAYELESVAHMLRATILRGYNDEAAGASAAPSESDPK